MALTGWLQLALFIGLLAALTKPAGLYLVRVLEPDGRTCLDGPLKPVERLLFRVLGVDPRAEQDWRAYARSLLTFSLAALLFTWAVLRLQHLLPLNPLKLGPVGPALAFNTAASFATNTDWQSYAGEATLSYLSQMVGLVLQNFVSAAVGIAVAAALVRGIARHSAKTVGHFWIDIVRINLYLLLPLSLAFSLFLTSQGVIQNFRAPLQATTLDSRSAGPMGRSPEGQTIPQGPAASQTAIKILGTNGGGFFNANAAHPYENPTPLSNFVQMLAILLLPSGLTYYLGRKVKNQKHGWAVWTAMAVLFLATALVCWKAESAGNPRLQALGVSPAGGNMEGKEVRFGVPASTLFATVTTAASCGAVNAMHDSFTPLGGLVPLFNIQLGEVVFGGVGAGLYGMLLFVVLAVFLTGLMVGRTPEYLGKKIESADVKLSVLAVLVPVFVILGCSAWALSSSWGLAGRTNLGPHGASEVLYAFSSAAGNNGSAFAGLDTAGPAYNLVMALAMLCGRFLVIVPVLALAGSLARKKLVPHGEAGFPASGPTFVIILIGTVLIVGALTFLPVLALGPIVEHFLMTGSGTLY
jgi:potassium-transporting ATPase potassium-binding subunit